MEREALLAPDDVGAPGTERVRGLGRVLPAARAFVFGRGRDDDFILRLFPDVATFQVDEEGPFQLDGVGKHVGRVLGDERGLGGHHELVQLGGAGPLPRLQHLDDLEKQARLDDDHHLVFGCVLARDAPQESIPHGARALHGFLQSRLLPDGAGGGPPRAENALGSLSVGHVLEHLFSQVRENGRERADEDVQDFRQRSLA